MFTIQKRKYSKTFEITEILNLFYSHVTQLSTNDLGAVTSREIRKLKSSMKKGNKQRQLQVEKLEENFKEALGRYSVVKAV